ncbi:MULTISPECIES: SAM-dependent methyltransferase [unclassified Streptomyces]|uniref:SAM-dependent methyltransferase n=1 Tax=unclassified Streptomyces TaxID=2593676 RepID=UPI002DDAAFD2|nr:MULTISPECIES: SAM-dependent methyltransferase [unclassified Streptomyces]WSA91054.1 SAM-dependent methyltransferase [Streptomyces sp. NBC_01795]WSB75379.1 SAM-dependent methyltransferase [Streptomyces sp. NBC_01775]WSS16339.1 SAM-dependent methyltransferase [Streptomyces sp. NBC_01186]WSS45156.1 SAM-dependent methyltransferase [Streptomyces sp. NBC_01187]
MERPAWAPQGIDLNVASVSRMYDYYLGGSHNFEVDRETARRAIQAWPGLPRVMQTNRAFMRRAIRFAVAEGVTQFLDIGSGIPTFGNVHEVAHALDRDARVVYVDNDPVAVAHSRAVVEGDARVGIVSADFRSPQDILESPEVEAILDMDRPVALMLVALLHFVEDRDEPAKTIAELARALAPGSLLMISHGSGDCGPRRDGTSALRKVYESASSPLIPRSKDEIARFFEDFEMIDPGLVPIPRWRPDNPAEQEDATVLAGFAGVGRKAGLAG